MTRTPCTLCRLILGHMNTGDRCGCCPPRARTCCATFSPYLLDDGEYIESATIWESSRICALAVDGQPQRSRHGVNFVLSELIAGIGEVAIITGLTQIVSVFDARIYRVLKAVGCNPQLIGKPRRIGGTMSYAGLFDTGEGLLQALQAFREELGIEAPEAKELALA